MELLFENYIDKIKRLEHTIVRDFRDQIDWTDRLIGIKGARGVGKTTLMLQQIKQLDLPPDQALYVCLDDLWFTQNTLVDLARWFVHRGGKYLFIDEVHKYTNWSQEVKNCYDTWNELNLVFTGSSMLHIHDARSDLSRRAMVYSMHGLSFREFLNLSLNKNFGAIGFLEIIKNHSSLAMQICSEIKPLSHFGEYLKTGYYPFFLENKKNYLNRLHETIMYITDVDLVQLRGISAQHIPQIKKLLYILSQSVPYKPNILKLSETIGISRNTLLTYLHYLQEAEIFTLLYTSGSGNSLLKKPDKLYLQNPNLYFSFSKQNANIGSLRETFFINQLSKTETINYSIKGDFVVNGDFIFEIGGRNKDYQQIADIPNSFIAADDIETGFGNKIPLWLFGFLY
jgi:uncharacterized protein